MKKDLYDNRYWLVVIGLLTMFFIFLAWIAYPESFWLLISLMIIVSVVLTAVPLLLNRRQKDRLDAVYRSFLIEPDMEKEAELRALVPKSEVDRLRILGDLLREKADELNRQDLQIRDYQTYIEEWVHEIKKPISLMSLVLDNRDDEMSTLVHLRMTRARNDIQSDVEKILYFARLSTAHRDYLFQPMSLVKVCQEAIVDHQSLLDEAGFEVALVGAEEVFVVSDRHHVLFILSQLIHNASKYARIGESQPKLDLTVEAGETIQLIISDNGPGIPQEDLPFIFDKGFTGGKAKATGMGLYLVQQIAQDLKVTVSASRSNSSGLAIILEFPIIN